MDASTRTAYDDIIVATERLFEDIASGSDADLRQAVATMNNRRRVIRAYEAALIPDRDEELQELKQCWHDRDIPKLKTLILKYYRRRQDLAPRLVQLINGDLPTQ